MLNNKVVILTITALTLLTAMQLRAQDFGVHGHTFEILEEDLQAVILRRLKAKQDSGELAAEQAKITQRVIHDVQHPKAVLGIKRATKGRIFNYDPTIHVPYDLKDQQGRVFHKKGTMFNPLKVKQLAQPLVFIDGDDAKQVKWFLQQFKDQKTKLILVKGAPLSLEQEINLPVFFDQEGILTSKLGIKAVPAVVKQNKEVLQIEEHLIN